MDVNAETARKLREMGAAELLAALSAQDEAVCAGMAFSERVQMAVDEAHSDFITQKVRNLTRRAGLRYPEADVRSVDFFEGRGLDRVAVAELATCGFVGRGENVVLQGLTGTGKTYLACALAKAACARRVRSCYIRQPDLEDLWRESRDRPGGERKLVRKYGAFGLLVIDEWLLDRPDTEFRSMLLELMELRYGTASTVFCTQFKKKDWHPSSAAGCMRTPSWTGSCTTRSGSTWARQTCASAADRPVAIKGHRGRCRPRCPSAISAVLFRDIQQCSSEQILMQRFRKCGKNPRSADQTLV